jgi:uncharacterized protein YdaU (DUF1376 family)
MHEEDGEIKGDRTPFLKLFTDDWLAGTRALSFEEKGFYLELLCMMWASKGGLPDDVPELARHLRADRRKVRRLLDALLADDKLQIEDGEIVNRRLMKDIGTARRRASSARLRGKVGEKSARSRREVSEKSARSRREVSEKSARKCAADVAKSETYPSTQNHPYSRSQTPEPEEERKEEVGVQLASVETEAARGGLAGAPDDVSETMLRDVEAWMHGGDRRSAEQWLATTIGIYGQANVREAYAKLKTDLASGTIVARKLPAFSVIAKRLKAQPADDPYRGMPPWKAERARQNAEFLKVLRGGAA